MRQQADEDREGQHEAEEHLDDPQRPAAEPLRVVLSLREGGKGHLVETRPDLAPEEECEAVGERIEPHRRRPEESPDQDLVGVAGGDVEEVRRHDVRAEAQHLAQDRPVEAPAGAPLDLEPAHARGDGRPHEVRDHQAPDAPPGEGEGDGHDRERGRPEEGRGDPGTEEHPLLQERVRNGTETHDHEREAEPAERSGDGGGPQPPGDVRGAQEEEEEETAADERKQEKGGVRRLALMIAALHDGRVQAEVLEGAQGVDRDEGEGIETELFGGQESGQDRRRREAQRLFDHRSSREPLGPDRGAGGEASPARRSEIGRRRGRDGRCRGWTRDHCTIFGLRAPFQHATVEGRGAAEVRLL